MQQMPIGASIKLWDRNFHMYIPTMYRCPLSATGGFQLASKDKVSVDGLELQAEGKFLNQSGLRGLVFICGG